MDMNADWALPCGLGLFGAMLFFGLLRKCAEWVPVRHKNPGSRRGRKF